MARTTRSAAAKATLIHTPLKSEKEPQQLSSPPATPKPAKRPSRTLKSFRNKAAAATSRGKDEQQRPPAVTPAASRKRKIAGKPKVEDADELPHNLGMLPASPDSSMNEGPSKKKQRHPLKQEIPITTATLLEVNKIIDQAAPGGVVPSPAKKHKAAKSNNYGLTPGSTPYPDWLHPTPEECHQVAHLLSKVHGEVRPPKTIPVPSLTTSGCGEVPSVLDALIRTRLSAATSGTNSSRAFKGLVDTFGILKSGIGKGSVDWDRVRRADVKEVFEAIKSGGLADVKSRDIKRILQMVWEENQERREALKNEGKEAIGSKAERRAGGGPEGAENEDKGEKNAEIEKAEEGVLSLDHLHLLSSDEAFNHLIKYPGIGPKTASCVLLFCLQRPSFAVDTHVFRLAKWLNWVPPTKATRNSTYSHLEVRIPDELKYPLHQLLIKHGKSCPRCRAITGESSAGWEGAACPIEEMVKRTGVRKGGAGGQPAGKKQTKEKKVKGGSKSVEVGRNEEAESGGESSELSDLEMEDGDGPGDNASDHEKVASDYESDGK